MLGMMEAFKVLAPEKDLESFQSGYYCRQEHIDVLEEENSRLRDNKKNYENNKQVIESLERIFKTMIKHEHSECGHCVYCDKQWSIIEMIEDRLEDFKK